MALHGYIMKSYFIELFGNSPQVKVLDFFIANYWEAWSMVEISKEIKAGYSTLKILLPRLVKKDFLKVKKKVGKINFYELNLKNPVILRLVQFDWALIKHGIGVK